MEASNGVQFSLSQGEISVSATVSAPFFNEKVLPVVELLLQRLAEGQGSQLAPPKTATQRANATGLDLSVRAIAEKLSSKTAGEVLTAAAASLTLVQRRDEFPWKDLLAEASGATGYWTKHHPGNASQALKALRTKGILVELANGNLALSPNARKDLAGALSENSK